MADPKVMSGNARFTIGTETIFHAQECSLDLSRELKERLTKDTGGVQSSKGKKPWTGSASGLMTYDADGSATSLDFWGLFDLFDDDTDNGGVDFEFVPDEADAPFKLTGKVIIENLNPTSNVDEDGTVSISFKGQGNIVKTAIPAV